MRIKLELPSEMAKDLMWILSRPLDDDDVTDNRIRLDSENIRIQRYYSETQGAIYFNPVRVYVKGFGY